MTVDPTDVLALLEEKPYTEAELLALFETSPQILRFTLKALKRDGQVKQVDTRWALASHIVPSAPASQTAPARRLPDVEELDDAIAAAAEDLEPADVIDEDETAAVDEQPDAPLPVRGERLGVNRQRLYPRKTTDAAGAPLRQASRISVPVEPAWWVGLDRQQLAAEIALRAEAMRGTKENLRVPLRILQ